MGTRGREATSGIQTQATLQFADDCAEPTGQGQAGGTLHLNGLAQWFGGSADKHPPREDKSRSAGELVRFRNKLALLKNSKPKEMLKVARFGEVGRLRGATCQNRCLKGPFFA